MDNCLNKRRHFCRVRLMNRDSTQVWGYSHGPLTIRASKLLGQVSVTTLLGAALRGCMEQAICFQGRQPTPFQLLIGLASRSPARLPGGKQICPRLAIMP